MEQRKSERQRLIYFLQVFNQDTEMFLGNLVNISPDGMLLFGEQPIEPGKRYKLRMNVQFLGQERTTLEVEAESRWCKNTTHPELYDAGFKLLNVPEEQHRLIDQLIKEFGFQ